MVLLLVSFPKGFVLIRVEHLFYILDITTSNFQCGTLFDISHIGDKEGIILEAETGDFLGNHRGFWFYTSGHRQGLRLLGGPWYVVEKDTKNNVVFVSRNYYSIDKRWKVFRVGSLLEEIRQC